MTQLAFIFGALAGLVCALLGVFIWKRLRPAVPGWMEGYDETHVAAFEQWPTTAFVLDPASQRIVAANPAALRNTGYTLEELRSLTLGQLFRAEGVEGAELLRRIKDSSSRTPLELKQCCKDGAQRSVERGTGPSCSGAMHRGDWFVSATVDSQASEAATLARAYEPAMPGPA